jgi:hypothetical protein
MKCRSALLEIASESHECFIPIPTPQGTRGSSRPMKKVASAASNYVPTVGKYRALLTFYVSVLSTHCLSLTFTRKARNWLPYRPFARAFPFMSNGSPSAYLLWALLSVSVRPLAYPILRFSDHTHFAPSSFSLLCSYIYGATTSSKSVHQFRASYTTPLTRFSSVSDGTRDDSQALSNES